MANPSALHLALGCLFLLSISALDDPPKAGVEDWFGIDVEAPGPDGEDKRSVRIKAFPGNNLTELAIQFFSGHAPGYNETDLRFVVNHLEEAGGGKCDACKTLVELMTQRFIEMGQKFSKVTGYDQYGKPQKSMHVEKEQETYIASLCKVERYNDFAPHIRKGCWDILSAANSRTVFNYFHNGTLGPETVVERKRTLCGDYLQMCEVKPPTPSGSMGKCRQCAEVMEDLNYQLRRANRQLVLGGADKLRKKMKNEVSGDFLSRKHILSEVEELCGALESLHPKSVNEDLVEMCEALTEEYTDDILAAFIARPRGHQLAMPGKEVCVKAADLCTEEQYERQWPLLESYHYNFTHYRSLPERVVVPDDDRVAKNQEERAGEEGTNEAGSDAEDVDEDASNAGAADEDVKLEL